MGQCECLCAPKSPRVKVAAPITHLKLSHWWLRALRIALITAPLRVKHKVACWLEIMGRPMQLQCWQALCRMSHCPLCYICPKVFFFWLPNVTREHSWQYSWYFRWNASGLECFGRAPHKNKAGQMWLWMWRLYCNANVQLHRHSLKITGSCFNSCTFVPPLALVFELINH